MEMNKKGSLVDIVFWGILLLFFGIVVLIGFKVTSEFNTQIQGMDIIPSNAKAASSSLVNNYSGVIDNSFLFLTIGIALGALVLAALVRVHPIFIPIFWVGLLVVIFISGIMSNIYQELAANENLIAQADQLTFISKILTYLPMFVAVFGHLLIIILYKLWKASNEI